MSLEQQPQPEPAPNGVAKERAKDDIASPPFNDNISQFLPTEVSCSGSDVEDETDDGGDDGDVEDADVEDTNGTAGTANSGAKFRGRPSSCVFVASLAASHTDDDLCISVTESFKKFGALTMVKVLRDPANRPYAFVQYTNDADARSALQQAQGSLLNGRTIRCEPARVNRTLFLYLRNQSESELAPMATSSNLGSEPLVISAHSVAALAEKFGEVEQIVASTDGFPLRHRGTVPHDKSFAWFIQFAYRDDAIRAFATLKSDRVWAVEWAQNIEAPSHLNIMNKLDSKDPNRIEDDLLDLSLQDQNVSAHETVTIDKKSIFVGQLSSTATHQSLHARFSRHGEILDLNLISKPNNVFAFIKFNSEEAAAAALEMENHAIFLNKTMHVQYREIGNHLRKVSRRQLQQQQQHQHHLNGNPSVFQSPRLNLAPPPINLGKRKQSQSLTSNPFASNSFLNHYSNYPIHELQPFTPPVNPKLRKNVEIASSTNKTEDSEINNSHSFATDATSNSSGSAGNPDEFASNSNTSRHYSSAGGMSYKKKYHDYKRRRHHYSHHNFDPYCYPQFYYPLEYSMAGVSSVPPPAPPLPPGTAGNQPYFMYYPFTPRSGIDYGEMQAILMNHIGTPMGPSMVPPPFSGPEIPSEAAVFGDQQRVEKQVLEY
ncbi:LAMI_0D07756g1_1 [Lachancea mirantina]|uniref:LAMI_0D07756g1_1 n=1 Tax=Lachancea mirantina TaxID=1230905 RepID=A0A1G4JCH7_9SACH|nr:LAMI_0D07756g1_1 [Lachancea mirantina]